MQGRPGGPPRQSRHLGNDLQLAARGDPLRGVGALRRQYDGRNSNRAGPGAQWSAGRCSRPYRRPLSRTLRCQIAVSAATRRPCNRCFLRRFSATVAGSVGRSSFFFRPPDTGRSNALWRRSGAAVARLALAPFAVGGSCERLRFKAAIRSMTGAGVEISRGLTGSPFRALLLRGGVR